MIRTVPTLPISRLRDAIRRAEHAFRNGWGGDIATPSGRRAAWLHFHLTDHQFLRGVWTNLHQFAPGAWRANQPSPWRLERYAAMGIRTIVNLRAPAPLSFHLFEAEACARLGLTLVTHGLAARALVSRDQLLALIDDFPRWEKPFLLHCKSGADRTGQVAAMWLIAMEGRPPEEALAQLHWRFAHLRSSATGVLDHMIEAYAAAHVQTGIGLRDWVATAYDPAALTASFARTRGRR